MDITLGKKKYELEFGFDFLRRLNDRCGLKANGINLKGAIENTMPSFIAGDLEVFVDYVWCAKESLTQAKVENYIESLIKKDEDGATFEKFVDEVTNEVQSGLTTRIPFRKMKAKMDGFVESQKKD